MAVRAGMFDVLTRRPFVAGCGLLGIWVLLVGGCTANTVPPVSDIVTPAERIDLQNRALDQLLLAAGSDLDVASCNAIEALVKVAPRDGLPLFRKALLSESPLVRYAGLVALGELRDHDSLDRIVAAVGDVHPQVRLAAAFAACRCGKDGYVRVLMRALNDAPEERHRADAATLLGRLEDTRARKWLEAALRRPSNAKSNRVTLAINGASRPPGGRKRPATAHLLFARRHRRPHRGPADPGGARFSAGSRRLGVRSDGAGRGVSRSSADRSPRAGQARLPRWLRAGDEDDRLHGSERQSDPGPARPDFRGPLAGGSRLGRDRRSARAAGAAGHGFVVNGSTLASGCQLRDLSYTWAVIGRLGGNRVDRARD